MQDVAANRRKDNPLRAAVNRIQAVFRGSVDQSQCFSAVLEELCDLSNSPFGFVFELLLMVDGKPKLRCASTYHADARAKAACASNSNSAKAPIAPWMIDINSGTKTFYSLLSYNQAAIYTRYQLEEFPFDPSWPQINNLLAIPIHNGTKTVAILGLCNSTFPYTLKFHQRCKPLLTALSSTLTALENQDENTQYETKGLLRRDSWFENYLALEINAPIGLITLDNELTILRINPAGEQIFKLSHSAYIGLHISALIPERYPNEHSTQTFCIGSQNKTHTLHGLNDHNELFAIEVKTSAFEERFNHRLLLMITDISELQHTKNRMNSEIQRFRALADLAPIGILQTNAKWETTYVNNRWLQMCGTSKLGSDGHEWCRIFHPNDAEEIITELHRRLINGKIFEHECRIIRTDNQQIWGLLHAQPLLDGNGAVSGFLATLTDNTYFHDSEIKLRELAEKDALTKLANRSLLLSRLDHALTRIYRKGSLALLSLDLDGFKNVNDSLGHDAGDELLIQVAQRLAHCVRVEDTISRIGGDEFILLLEGLADASTAADISEKVLTCLRAPFQIGQHEVFISGSIGICYAVSGRDNTSKTLLKQADMALYQAKAEGRNNYQYFSPDLDQASRTRMELGSNLNRALVLEEFEVFYQLQARVATGELVGLEALLRWNHPKRGLLVPDEFISLLEDIGIMGPVSRWLWQSSFQQLRAWIDRGFLPADEVMSVNISPRQFRDPLLIDSMAIALADAAINPSNVVVEITETALMQENTETHKALKALKCLGVRIALDDFGTGYSSLSYLKKYPIDIIKIDRSFIMDLLADQEDVAITQAVLALARSLKLEVIAEGVENNTTLQKLKSWECDIYQGYLLNRPMPSDQMVQLFTSHSHIT